MVMRIARGIRLIGVIRRGMSPCLSSQQCRWLLVQRRWLARARLRTKRRKWCFRLRVQWRWPWGLFLGYGVWLEFVARLPEVEPGKQPGLEGVIHPYLARRPFIRIGAGMLAIPVLNLLLHLKAGAGL